MSEDDFDDVEEPLSPARPGLPVDFTRVLRSVARRWRWFAIGAVVSGLLGVVLAKTIAPKTYTSRSVIVWEGGEEQTRQDLRTLVDSILIPANLTEVKRRTKSPLSLEALALSVEVYFDPDSDVVSVEASAGSAKDATTLADTVIAVFLEYCRQLQRSRREGALQSLKANLEVARASLTNAQEVYDTFRRENQIINVSEETALAIQSAASLRSLAEVARGEAQAEAARARLLDQSARQQREMVVTSQSQTDPNADALANVRTQLLEARERLSADHPRVLALEAQAAALQSGQNKRTTVSTGQNSQLASIRTAMAESTTARAAALERQQVYSEHAAQAREQLQKLSAVEGQAAVLLSEVTTASDHVTQLEAQIGPAEEGLRSALQSFRVIAPADVPPYPASGKGKLYATGIPGGTLVLLLLFVLGLELRGLRVHTAREAAFWINGPTVGTSTWPRVPEALSELLAEVGDCTAAATGHTLIVGASPGDERAAQEIAAGLRQRVESSSRSSEPESSPRALIGETPSRTTLTEVAPVKLVPAVTGQAQTALATTVIQTWDTTQKAVTLRRASRLSDRVIVVLTADTLSMLKLAALRTRLGRERGVGVLLVGVDPALSDLPDRVGDVDGFWEAVEYTEA